MSTLAVAVDLVPVAESAALTDWIGLGIGLATAVATALAAWAAWRAASASERTSREAREALVAALEPALVMELADFAEPDGDPPGPRQLWLRVTNVDRLTSATDLGMKVRFSDGTEVSAHRDVLRPCAGGDDWFAALREVTDAWPPPGGEEVMSRVEYSDAQGAGRHELTRQERVAPDSVGAEGEEATTKPRIK